MTQVKDIENNPKFSLIQSNEDMIACLESIGAPKREIKEAGTYGFTQFQNYINSNNHEGNLYAVWGIYGQLPYLESEIYLIWSEDLYNEQLRSMWKKRDRKIMKENKTALGQLINVNMIDTLKVINQKNHRRV